MSSAQLLRRGIVAAILAFAAVAVAGRPAQARPVPSRHAVANAAFRNWAQFRYNADHEGVNPIADGLNATSAHGLVKKWSFGTVNADFVRSSPAFQNGVVYCGAD